ncbi:hypothetical protein B0T10DRAFT_487755 [Thelonectria olida]|uniref:Zn(2)-C6 fungal-type domain-containing protein n=1 Tax=Thelonectria olida TaxID=1576542 RepID=A0A9P8W331_9HYPO|nr:hypothetical protein B0T10DRAFT_487755 [Thelonectria olida]
MPPRRRHRSARPATDDDHARLRRAHRKSRGGCQECKRRHVKCDEVRPSCTRCSKTRRDCLYKDAAPTSTPPPTVIDAQRDKTPTQAEGSEATDETSETPSSITEALKDFMLHVSSDEDALLVGGWPLSREHMALLHHAEEHYLPFGSPDPSFQPIVQEVIETAWTAPYLMDVVLALAALHLSELNPSQAASCRQQAMQLQTRGLMLFNEAKEDILPETCLPMFMFSSVVGTTVLYDVLRSHRDSFTDFWDRFVSYLRLHRGVSVITGRSWSILQKSKITAINQNIPRGEQLEALIEQGTECNALDDMLDQSDLGAAAVDACREAVHFLRAAFAIYHHSATKTGHGASAPISFAARVNPLFIDLAEQRQPEALLVVAYYAVLLHWCRESWIFGDAGEFLMRGITTYVGTYWQQWLVFPKTFLDNTSSNDS